MDPRTCDGSGECDEPNCPFDTPDCPAADVDPLDLNDEDYEREMLADPQLSDVDRQALLELGDD